jgi:uncharacterized repeat protein (TIGR01451 family)
MGDALPGDTLTYALRYKNTSSTAAKDVTFVDYLQPGQTFLIAYNAGCSLDQASRLLTCALPSIGPSASGDVLVAVVVDQGFSGLLTNVAQVSAANAPTSFSNPTQVLVHATAPPGAGKLLVCGTVVASTSTGIIIGTVPLPFAGAVTPTGVPIAVGQDLCVEATLNTAGRVTALSVSVNLPNVSLVCGILGSAGGASAPTSVTLTGITFPVATGAQLVGPFVTGQIYCFTLDASGAINGLLSTTPTSATPVPDETSGRRVGHHWLS